MLSAGGRVLDTGTCMWRGGRQVQTQRRTVSPGSTSSGADKEGIADRRPPSRAEEAAEASDDVEELKNCLYNLELLLTFSISRHAYLPEYLPEW